MQRVVLGPFTLDEPVGRGGTGVVFRGIHLATELPVAVKVLHPASLQDGSPPEAFHNEVRAVASLDHPGIVWVFDADVVSEESEQRSNHSLVAGSPYLAMEYASGGTLADWIPPDFSAVEELIEALLEALGHAHARNVVHRDLKPHNVLRGGPGDVRPGWKLTDFGIAANFQQTMERSLAGGLVGTLSYMSPEQIKGEWRRYGAWTDLYALGCVLYKVLVGKRPWESVRGTALLSAHLDRPPEPLKPKVSVPEGFTDWVSVLLEKRPADRFQSAAEALLAFRGLGPAVPPVGEASWGSLGSPEQTEVIGLVDRRRDRVGLPLRWHQHEAPWPPPRLVGSGLGLLTLRTWPMVGRRAERDQLWEAVLETVRTQCSQVVVIRGHAGVGKSRLARWIGESANALGGLTFLQSEARPGEPPDVATLAAFRRWLRTERLDDDDRLLHLRSLFPDASIEWLTDLSALVAPGSEGHGRQVQGDARHELLGQLLARMTDRGRPAVLLFDNAHASTDVLRFARYLEQLDTTGGAVALVVLVISDESLSEAPHAAQLLDELLVDARTLSLPPLPPEALSELIQAVLPMESLLAAQVAERTGGNPQHAVQVLQGWARQGLLIPGLGGFELDRGALDPGDFDVPSMEAVWAQRLGSILDGLPQAAQILLERAATLGPRVNALEWQRACDDPRGQYAAEGRVVLDPEQARLREVLTARLLAARLVDETPKGWAFAHEMFRETILGLARAAGRLPSHHRTCARVLLHLEHSHRYAERIGRHLLAGHRPHSAIPQLMEGIRRCRRRSGDAATLPLLREVEHALEDAGVPEGDRAWCELAALRGDVFVGLGRSLDADRWAGITQALARDGGWPQLQAHGMWLGAQVLLDGGDPAAADGLLADAERLLGDGSPALRGQIHAARSRCARRRGESGPSRGHAVLAAQALKEAGGSEGIASAWQLLGEDAIADGRLGDAVAYLEHAWHHHRWSPVGRGTVAALLGEIALARGELEDARQRLQSAVQTLRRAGSARATTASLVLAQVHLARRDWGAAQQIASGLVRRPGFEQIASHVLVAHAVLLAAAAGTRDWSAWDLHLERVRAGLGELQTPEPGVSAALELAAHRTATAGEAARAAALDALEASLISR